MRGVVRLVGEEQLVLASLCANFIYIAVFFLFLSPYFVLRILYNCRGVVPLLRHVMVGPGLLSCGLLQRIFGLDFHFDSWTADLCCLRS